jgi:aliphatic nitrilase
MLPKFKVAVAHVAPVFLDKDATTEKAVSIIREAASHGAELVVFPESFIPAFPIWAAIWAPYQNHDFFVAMAAHSLLRNGPEIETIRQEARRMGIFVSLGFSELSQASLGCLWNANLLIDDQGDALNHHRKLVPTFFEKLIWANGDGAGLRVSDTRLGRIGNLICGENTNPLARYALMAQGEQVHIATWPPIWPSKRPRTGGNYDNINANHIRVAAHCFEAKVFGIACSGYLDSATRNFLVNHDETIADIVDDSAKAASFFVDPTGMQVGEHLQASEGILYGEIDIGQCVEPKQFHDVVGYYNRFDIFRLTVRRERDHPIAFSGDDTAPNDFPALGADGGGEAE